MAALPPGRCPHCGAEAEPSYRFCRFCGRNLSEPVGAVAAPAAGATVGAFGLSTPAAQPLSGPPIPGSWQESYFASQARDRTITGLTLLFVGFLLIWIPYVGDVGGLLALIGVIFLILGRAAFGEDHERYVVLGGVLYLGALILVAITSAVFAVTLIGQASAAQSSNNLAALSSQFTNDFATFFLIVAVLGPIGAIGEVVMVYGLADRFSRILLWSAFAAGLVVSATVAAVLFPQITGAVASAVSGATFNSAPLTQLQTTSALLGMLQAGPSLLFAWAYYRCRTRAGGKSLLPSAL